jgi:hypothetical protein
MDRDKFSLVPAAEIVNGVSDQFLPGTAFTFDQNIGGRRSDLADGVEHLVQNR